MAEIIMAAIINFFKGNTKGHTWVKFEVNWNYGSGDIKVQRSEGIPGLPQSWKILKGSV